jgi:hypothetical protein
MNTGDEADYLEEYYFDNFYRVLVIRENEKYVVSVDVYYNGWKYINQKEVCVENTCLLVKEIDPNDVKAVFQSVEKIFIIGVKVNDKLETVNVKWVSNSKPNREVIEEIYKYSWKIASGEVSANTK